MRFLSPFPKKYERGDLPKSDWLDALTFRKITEIHAVCAMSFAGHHR